VKTDFVSAAKTSEARRFYSISLPFEREIADGCLRGRRADARRLRLSERAKIPPSLGSNGSAKANGLLTMGNKSISFRRDSLFGLRARHRNTGSAIFAQQYAESTNVDLAGSESGREVQELGLAHKRIAPLPSAVL